MDKFSYTIPPLASGESRAVTQAAIDKAIAELDPVKFDKMTAEEFLAWVSRNSAATYKHLFKAALAWNKARKAGN